MAKINLDINGKKQVVDVDPKTPMLWVLRDALGVKGSFEFGWNEVWMRHGAMRSMHYHS